MSYQTNQHIYVRVLVQIRNVVLKWIFQLPPLTVFWIANWSSLWACELYYLWMKLNWEMCSRSRVCFPTSKGHAVHGNRVKLMLNKFPLKQIRRRHGHLSINHFTFQVSSFCTELFINMDLPNTSFNWGRSRNKKNWNMLHSFCTETPTERHNIYRHWSLSHTRIMAPFGPLKPNIFSHYPFSGHLQTSLL